MFIINLSLKLTSLFGVWGYGKIRDLATKVADLEGNATSGGHVQAAQDLKSLKRTIWDMSMQFTAEQKALRSLMGPIDALSGKWGAGASASSASLQKKLNEVADRLSGKPKA